MIETDITKKSLVDLQGAWQMHPLEENHTIYVAGTQRSIERIKTIFCDSQPLIDKDWLIKTLSELEGHFAAIVESENWVIAFTDKIRSYPVAYTYNKKEFRVSNSAAQLKNKFDLNEINDVSCLEFEMAGYVTGNKTIYKYLYQLQAGEYLLWQKKSKHLERNRYFIYYSEKLRGNNEKDLIDKLEECTNKIFRQVMDDADGRPIWVPLSGGLDSRLIVSKLKELGYDNLQSYSYGPVGNYEAKVAKIVAGRLDIPWQFIPITRRDIRSFFKSDVRKSYFSFADNLSTVPILQDLSIRYDDKRKLTLPKDAVLINGQSGDFISGGHVPEFMMSSKATVSDLINFIIGKHFSLWEHRKTKENIEKISIEIKNSIPMDIHHLYQMFEYWEWQERQCKYVINSVRMYDYWGYSWLLPLWDDQYLRFWREVPVKFKLNQYLYKQYLKKYNFKNLFKDFNHTIWRWPGATLAVLPFARLVRLIGGDKNRELFLNYMRYFGHYSYLYGAYNYSYYFKHANSARNPISFFAKTWLEEKSINSIHD